MQISENIEKYKMNNFQIRLILNIKQQYHPNYNNLSTLIIISQYMLIFTKILFYIKN